MLRQSGLGTNKAENGDNALFSLLALGHNEEQVQHDEWVRIHNLSWGFLKNLEGPLSGTSAGWGNPSVLSATHTLPCH